jgi:TonB family protein
MRNMTLLIVVISAATLTFGCSSDNPVNSDLAVFRPPVMVSYVQPEYPRLAHAAGIEGTATVKCLISESGEVLKVKVSAWTGSDGFSDQSYYAAWRNTWRPAYIHLRPVAAWAEYTVEFKLSSAE